MQTVGSLGCLFQEIKLTVACPYKYIYFAKVKKVTVFYNFLKNFSERENHKYHRHEQERLLLLKRGALYDIIYIIV